MSRPATSGSADALWRNERKAINVSGGRGLRPTHPRSYNFRCTETSI